MREYGLPFTVVRRTSRQNSGLTSGRATTSGFEIEYSEEAETEATCDHGQHPIVPVAPIDGFAVNAARIEHAVHNVVELAERPLYVAFALLFRLTV